MNEDRMNRRAFTRLAAGAAIGVAASGAAFAATEEDPLVNDYVPDSQDLPRLLRRISSLRTREWQDYFSDLSQDAILADTSDRVLHYWGSDGFYRIYPTSVPLTEEMTRRGRTTVTLKRPDPDWRPTAAMLVRHPGLPRLRRAGPGQSARHPRTQPRLAGLSHPRHQRYPQDRPSILQRLYRAFQRAYPRGLRPRPDRNASVAHLTTSAIYWACSLSAIENARESWLVFRH